MARVLPYALILALTLFSPLAFASPASAYSNPSYAQLSTWFEAAAVQYEVPPQVLKAVCWQESGWRQFDAAGNPLIGFDGKGIGLMQLTDKPQFDQTRLRTDPQYNIQAGAQILGDAWGWSQAQNAKVGLPADDKDLLENWYYPVADNNWNANPGYVNSVIDHVRNPPSPIAPYLSSVWITLPGDAIPGFVFPAYASAFKTGEYRAYNSDGSLRGSYSCAVHDWHNVIPPPPPSSGGEWVASAVVIGNPAGSSATGSQGWTPVTFSVTTGPWTVHVRSGPGTSYGIVRDVAASTAVTCYGWQHGEVVSDAWYGTPDARWYRIDQPVSPAQLSVVGDISMSSSPYTVGNTATGSFTVKNTGGQSGTWTPLVLAFRGPSGENRDAVAASSITLAAGESRIVSFSRQLDIAGNWTGFVSGQLIGGPWQSLSGATVAFTVAADTTSPSTTISGVPGSWTNANVSFSLAASDNSGGSGLKAVYYTLNGSQSTYSDPVGVSIEGVTTVTYWAVDNNNNAEGAHTATIRIDKTAPATTDDHVATYAGSATVHLSATDARSGVAHTYYTLSGLSAAEGSTVAIGGANTYTLAYWSVDAAGNAEARHTVAFAIVTPPSSGGIPSTPASIATLRRGRAFTVWGYIVRHTAGTYPVTLQFYRYQSGHWVLRKSTTAKVSNILTFSKYSRSTSVPYSGKWRVRARHKVGSKYLYSGYRNFTAT